MTTKPRMTDLEASVIHDLDRSHHGRANVIKEKALADRYNVPLRRIADVVKSLVEVHHFPVVTFRTHPKGVCIAETDAEIDESLRTREAAWRSQYFGCLALKEAWRRRKQGRLF